MNISITIFNIRNYIIYDKLNRIIHTLNFHNFVNPMANEENSKRGKKNTFILTKHLISV